MKAIVRLEVVFLFILMLHVATVEGNELYFIDAHSQVDHKVFPLKKIISLMKKGGVSHTILSARGKLKGKSILKLAAQYPDYITPSIRTKGQPYETGAEKYYRKLDAQVRSRRFSAMAEVLLYHAQKGDKAPEYIIYPDDKRVRAALKHAIDNGWPFIVHIEFSALHDKKKNRFMESLEEMLDQFPDHPFVLTHMGQLKPDECRLLIQNHKNLHFHTGWSNPVAVESSNQPWVNLFNGRSLTSRWHNLFTQYPDRFIFALDNVFEEHWTEFYVKQMEYWKKALEDLPAEAAHLIAHGNAERLWGIQPRN